MAEDVAPELLEKIKKSFEDGIEQNEAIKKLSKKLDNGGWGFLEAEHYALEVGKELSSAFLDNLSSDVLPNGRMYYNIASRIIPPMMWDEYEMATDAALQVVANINEKAGVRIAPQKPLIDEDRVKGIVDKVSDADYFDDVKYMLDAPVQNFAVHCVDKTVEQNALFQHRAGLRPRIKRDSGGKCCDWCAALDGMYEYPGVPRDIFMRHENCNCTVEYLPGDGRAQDVFSKEYRDLDAVEERKAFSERAADAEEARERVLKAERLQVAGKSENVTREFFRSADPGNGSVIIEPGITDGQKSDEKEMAEWIKRHFGGDVIVRKEIPDQLNADYVWDSKLWELKTISTAKASDAAVRKGMKQILSNPGGIVLDCRNCRDSRESIYKVVEERTRQKNVDAVDVIYVFGENDYTVIRYR